MNEERVETGSARAGRTGDKAVACRPFGADAPYGGFAEAEPALSSPPHPKRLRPAFLTPGVGGRNEMYSETLSHPLNDLDRYLMYDANEPRGSVPSPEPTWLEVEMKIRLANGNQVTVTEHVESMADLGEALEKARLRLALTMARDVLDAAAANDPLAALR